MPYSIDNWEEILKPLAPSAMFIEMRYHDPTIVAQVSFKDIDRIWEDLAEVVALNSRVRVTTTIFHLHNHRENMIEIWWSGNENRDTGEILLCLPDKKSMAEVCYKLWKWNDESWSKLVNGYDPEFELKSDTCKWRLETEICKYYKHALVFDEWSEISVQYYHDEEDAKELLAVNDFDPDKFVEVEARGHPGTIMYLYRGDDERRQVIWCYSSEVDSARAWFAKE